MIQRTVDKMRIIVLYEIYTQKTFSTITTLWPLEEASGPNL